MPEDSEVIDNLDQEVDYITGKLGDDEDGAAPETESEAHGAEDAAPAEEQPSGDEVTESEPEATPPIEAPLSWSTDAKETFKALPREAQQVIADRERARDVELRRAQNEAAEIKKAVESERQALTAQLQNAISIYSNFDPVIAEGLKTDWAKLGAEDPAGYIAKRAAFDDRLQKLNAGQAQLQEINHRNLQQRLADEDRKLVEKIPEWSDPEKGKAELGNITQKAKSLYGIELPQVMAQMPDHNVILVLRDALKYHDMVAAQRAAQAKKVNIPPKRVQKPGGREDNSGTGRVLALKQRAAKTGTLEDRANAVLAALDEG